MGLTPARGSEGSGHGPEAAAVPPDRPRFAAIAVAYSPA